MRGCNQGGSKLRDCSTFRMTSSVVWRVIRRWPAASKPPDVIVDPAIPERLTPKDDAVD